MFRSLIHFEFIFVHGVRKCSNFILLHAAVQFSQHNLLKSLFLLIVYSSLLCHRLIDHRCMGLFLGFLCCTMNTWFFAFCLFVSLGLHLRHMEVPRLGVELELQLLVCITACGNSGSLTHWLRPGIESSFSRIQVRFLACWATTGAPPNALLLTKVSALCWFLSYPLTSFFCSGILSRVPCYI